MIRFRSLNGLARAYLIETWRSKPAIFWNLVFPLVTLIGVSYVFANGEPIRVAEALPGVLTINLMAASFFGVTLHMVSLREQGIYRRFRLTPLSALTVVLAHSLIALVNILASTLLQLLLAKALFHIEFSGSLANLLLAVLVAAFAFIPLGLLLGSVVKDMKTAPAISNLLFFPMLFLSGAAMPLFLMQPWLQHLATLIPATYVVELLQATLLRGESPSANKAPVAILLATGVIGLACNAAVFRWEGRERINSLGLAATIASLSVLYIAVSAGGIKLESTRPPADQQVGPVKLKLESNARVLKGMTILDGLGGRIEHGLVVIRGDRIVYVGDAERTLPEGAPVTDLSGLFLMPGLIDSHVHLGASAGGSTSSAEYRPARVVRDLQVYLGQGVTSVVSMTDNVNDMLSLRKAVAGGVMRAPRTYLCGLSITAPGGIPAKYFAGVPGVDGLMALEVDTPQKAQAAVQQLVGLRVDFVKLFLDGGGYKDPAPVMSDAVFRMAVQTAKAKGLLTTVQVDNDQHTRFAIESGVRGIELVPPDLSDQTIMEMVTKGVTLTPALAASEGLARTLRGEPITDPATLQWVDPVILASLRSPDSWLAPLRADPAAVDYYTQREKGAFAATRRAVASGVTIIAGSDAGNPGSFHGLGLIRELELLVDQAKMTPGAALVSATGAAARRLGSTEVGQVAPGAYADLIVLGSDPTKNIRAVRDIRTIYFGGMPLQRNTLLSTPPGRWTPESAGVQVEKR